MDGRQALHHAPLPECATVRANSRALPRERGDASKRANALAWSKHVARVARAMHLAGMARLHRNGDAQAEGRSTLPERRVDTTFGTANATPSRLRS